MCLFSSKKTVIHSYSINQPSWENNISLFSIIAGSSPCPERITFHFEQFETLFFLTVFVMSDAERVVYCEMSFCKNKNW